MRRTVATARFVCVFALLAATLGAIRQTRAGQPILPDLRTLPATGMYLDTAKLGDGRTHYLLRFDNTVGNWGGRLEIVANLSRSRDLYQNIYDAYNGGNLVSHTKVSSDLIYHPSHNHFHFSDFASYRLLKKDSKGIYRQTTRRGTKTSFCIIDTIRVAQIGSGASSYTTCNPTRQGLSAGWGDVYTAGLPDQWIDLGTTRPANGDYAIQSTADPNNKLAESNDANNTATTYFTISGGNVTVGEQLPTCTLTPASGPVGTPVVLYCAKMTPGDKLDIRWGGRSTSILTTVTVDSQHRASASLVIPDSSLGNHYVYATSQSTGASALALFTTKADLDTDATSGIVGSSLGISVTGFVAQEEVTIRYTTTGSTTVVLARITANSKGSASGFGKIPVSVFGPHKIEAKGGTSGATVSTTFSVTPSLKLFPASAAAGGTSSPSLRGFKKYETVTLTLLDEREVLRTVRTSSTGSANATAGNAFTIPDNLDPGDYLVAAVGSLSGVPVTAVLTVTETHAASRAASAESPTPTATVPPPTATTIATLEPSPTPTQPDPTATATPPPTVELYPSETPEPNPSPVNDDQSNAGQTDQTDGTPTT
jgi:hypothetical protein